MLILSYLMTVPIIIKMGCKCLLTKDHNVRDIHNRCLNYCVNSRCCQYFSSVIINNMRYSDGIHSMSPVYYNYSVCNISFLAIYPSDKWIYKVSGPKNISPEELKHHIKGLKEVRKEGRRVILRNWGNRRNWFHQV